MSEEKKTYAWFGKRPLRAFAMPGVVNSVTISIGGMEETDVVAEFWRTPEEARSFAAALLAAADRAEGKS